MTLNRKPAPSTVAFLGVLGVFFALFLAYPVSFMLRHGFGHSGEFSLRFFALVVHSPVLRQSFANSFLLATFTVLLTSLIVLPLAQGFHRWRFPGKEFLGALLLVPMIMPPFVGAIGLKQLFARYGSLNLFLMDAGLMNPASPIDWLNAGGFWGMILLQTLNLYPILFLNVSAGLAAVDPSMAEAARNLGASPSRVFRTITLPLILPGWFAGASIVWIFAFTDLGTPLILGFSHVVPVQIFDAVNDLNTNPQGYVLVSAVLAMTVGLFAASRRVLSTRSFATMARGPVDEGSDASPIQTAVIWCGGLLLATLALLPLGMVLLTSVAGHWFMTAFPGQWTLEHYTELFGDGLTGTSISNSLFYATGSAIIDLILGVGIAWIVTRSNLPFAGLLDSLAMLPLALPGLVLAFGYFAGFEIDGTRHPFFNSILDPRTNPTLLLIVSYSVRRLPYQVRSAIAGFQQTNVLLEEASAAFGASPWQTFVRITLPLVKANVLAGFILTFSFAMLEVSDSLILAQNQRYFPITKQMWLLIGRIDPGASGAACALGVVGLLVLVGCLYLASRFLGKRIGDAFRA